MSIYASRSFSNGAIDSRNLQSEVDQVEYTVGVIKLPSNVLSAEETADPKLQDKFRGEGDRLIVDIDRADGSERRTILMAPNHVYFIEPSQTELSTKDLLEHSIEVIRHAE